MPDPPRIPGVFVREVPEGVPPIAGVETGVTAFVGRFARGPVDVPVPVTSFAAFIRSFGGLHADGPASFAVRQFFLNGGRRARVVRVGTAGMEPARAVLAGPGGPVLRVAAACRAGGRSVEDPGSWGDRLRVAVSHGSPGVFDLTIRELAPDGGVVRLEAYQGLGMDPDAPNAAIAVVNARSGLVRLERAGLPSQPDAVPAPTAPGHGVALSGGADGGPPDADGLLGRSGTGAGMRALGDGWDLLSIPEAALLDPPDEARRAYRAAADHCRERRAFLLVDLPPGIDTPQEMAAWVEGGVTLRHDHAALHVPRLVVSDRDDAPPGERTVGSSGTMAGVYARMDHDRGVWKAPAGTSAHLRHVIRPAGDLTRSDMEILNPKALNAIATIPNVGLVSWGARTLAGHDRGSNDWRYVPVRRFALYLERSLEEGLAWTVFEPNDPPLWTRIRMAVDGFMERQFRAGALQGRTAEEAWFTRCGPRTTSEADRRAGRVILHVGFAPLKPAEFIVLTITLRAGAAAP